MFSHIKKNITVQKCMYQCSIVLSDNVKNLKLSLFKRWFFSQINRNILICHIYDICKNWAEGRDVPWYVMLVCRSWCWQFMHIFMSSNARYWVLQKLMVFEKWNDKNILRKISKEKCVVFIADMNVKVCAVCSCWNMFSRHRKHLNFVQSTLTIFICPCQHL